MDGLHSDGDLAEDPELVSGVEKLGVLQVRHLYSQVPHQAVVDQGRGGRGQVWGHQASKGSPFHTKDELFVIVSVPVTHGRINVRTSHHFEIRWFLMRFCDESSSALNLS